MTTNWEGKLVETQYGGFVLVPGVVPTGAVVDVTYPDGAIQTHTVVRMGLGPDPLLGGQFASRCSIERPAPQSSGYRHKEY